jgi:hypothetical protein
MWDWKLGEINGFKYMTMTEEYVIVKQGEFILAE